MKLERLRILSKEVATEFSADISNHAIYYFHKNQWNLLDGPCIEEGVFSRLEAAKGESIAYHVAADKTAWFECNDVQCTIALSFNSSPRIVKRKSARARLTQAIQRANNAYRVAHNPLTFLLARDEFRFRLTQHLDAIAAEKEPASTTGAFEKNLAVLALDIDHFKQINDTYGHIYGDQVLKVFARRLEHVARRLNESTEGKCEILLGHPSGEEFTIMIRGTLTQEQIVEYANQFRSSICDQPLPSDEDWVWLSEVGNLASIVPPPVHERSVSTSIGATFMQSVASKDLTEDRVTRLLEQADTALYRAKAAGRNQVIAFDSIMSSCGRVLEHDATTRVVAIDIGKNVGVTFGQEFKVFTDGFTGKKKFILRDSRTARTLGTYPRVELTRITAFDVQPELSFCFISNAAEINIDIASGSHLEAIPIGSIGQILPHAARYFANSVSGTKVGDISTLHEFIKSDTKASKKYFAAVFRFTKSDDYLKQYGVAALNSALTRLFRAISSEYSVATAVGVLDTASVCVVGRSHVYNETRLDAFTAKLAEEFAELGLVAGIFSEQDIEKKPAGSNSKLDISHAIEFARFAASDNAIITPGKPTHFNHQIASAILSRQREAQSFQSAAADFDKLLSLGVSNTNILNLGGLINSALGNTQRAFEHFRSAADLDPADIVLTSNFGTTASPLGLIDEGLEALNKLNDAQVNSLKSIHPFGYVNYARLLARGRIAGSKHYNHSRFMKIGPEALAVDGYINSKASEVIKTALSQIGFQ